MRIQSWCQECRLNLDGEQRDEIKGSASHLLYRHCQIPGCWRWHASTGMQSIAHNLPSTFFHSHEWYVLNEGMERKMICNKITIFWIIFHYLLVRSNIKVKIHSSLQLPYLCLLTLFFLFPFAHLAFIQSPLFFLLMFLTIITLPFPARKVIINEIFNAEF